MATSRGSGAETDRVRTETEDVKANVTGAYVAIAGVVIFTVSVFLDWMTRTQTQTPPEGGEGEVAQGEQVSQAFSGYEADSLIPFAAFLGIGFAVALLYAASRAYRRQHRGLSLASMAVGLAVTLFTLAWILDIPGAAERGSDVSSEGGVWLGLLGASLWALGSGLLAKEPEGDPEHRTDQHDNRTAQAR